MCIRDRSSSGARQVFEQLWSAAESAAAVGEGQADAQARIDTLVERLGLRQVNDSSALQGIVDAVLADNPKLVEDVRSGKEKAFNALVGQAMKRSQGKANPGQLGDLFRQALG